LAEFYDISNWNEKLYFQPGGTRNKVVVEHPTTHDLYFFKTSLKKEQKDYKYEFWSEILASEVGIFLGFDMLRYDIAYNKDEIGCISKSMVTEGKNKLTEGISYLTGYDTTYNPDDKASRKQYTFQRIKETMEYFRLENIISNIVEIIIFDSIIGNGDRHQENWGIITEYNEIIAAVEEIAKRKDENFAMRLLFSVLAITSKAKRKELETTAKNLHLMMPGSFSQIYDSGSCLGREISDEKIPQILKDKTMMDAFIRRGESEIHWEGEKINHFDLISKLKKLYPDQVEGCIRRVKSKYIGEKLRSIINKIDSKLPSEIDHFKLPDERKEFIFILITLRLEKLFAI
jgi:hypothetical protein